MADWMGMWLITRPSVVTKNLPIIVTRARFTYYLPSHLFTCIHWLTMLCFLHNTLRVLIKHCTVYKYNAAGVYSQHKYQNHYLIWETYFFLLHHVYLHPSVLSFLPPPSLLFAPLRSNTGDDAPADKWALGEMAVVETLVADTCDVSILRRGESDSENTYKRRCCQIMQ